MGLFSIHVVRMTLIIWAVDLTRKTMRDYTFADGTFMPKGTLIGIGVNAVHFDDRVFENARMFEPFRFADMDKVNVEGAKHRFVTTGVDYLSFGHGKHAWYVALFFPPWILNACYQ